MKKSESSSDRIERAADESEQDPQSVSAQGLDLVQVHQMAEQGSMSAQIIMDAFAQSSGPLPVYDADTGKMCHVGVIQILVQLGDGLIHGLSEKIEFHGHGC